MAKKKSKKVMQQAPPVDDIERKVRTIVKNVSKPGVSRKIKAALALTGLSATAAGTYAYSKKKKVKENLNIYLEYLTENEFLQQLNTDNRAQAKEWQGPNIPHGDDSNRPNLIRKCTMLESATQKINCLRKLRDQAAMNPFYQYRIDRYIDEITDTYEPTGKPGTIPGNEFKTSGVGEDTPVDVNLTEKFSPQAKFFTGSLATATVVGALRLKRCKRAYPGDKEKIKKCFTGKEALWQIPKKTK